VNFKIKSIPKVFGEDEKVALLVIDCQTSFWSETEKVQKF